MMIRACPLLLTLLLAVDACSTTLGAQRYNVLFIAADDLRNDLGCYGNCLATVLEDPRRSVRTAALSQHPRPAYYQGAPETMGYSIRTDRFRYTEWRDWQTGAVMARELYDHAADADETRNVAGWPEHAGDVKQCAVLLAQCHPIVQPGWKPVLP